MVWTCVDSVLHQLSEIQACQDVLTSAVDARLYMQINIVFQLPWETHQIGVSKIDAIWEEAYGQIPSYKRELMFQKMMMCCFELMDDTDTNIKSMITNLQGMWDDLEERIEDTILLKPEPEMQDWDLLNSFLQGTIQQCKRLIVDYCCVLLDSSLKCKPLTSNQALLFLQIVLQNLEVLVRHNTDVILTQLDPLKVRLILLQNFFQLISGHEDIDCEELRAFKLCLQTFAYDAASLVFLFWAKSANVENRIEAKTNHVLSYMHQNIIKPYGSDGTSLWLSALRAIKLQPSDDTLLQGEVIEGFVHLYLDSAVVKPKDDLQAFRKGLLFLLTFMTNPPERCDQDEQLAHVCDKIDLLFSKCTYLSKEHSTKDYMLSSDFAEKLEETMHNIIQLYFKIPDSLSYDFPKTNGLGFYDSLLQTLERLKKLSSSRAFTPYVNNFIIKIEEEMVSLRPKVGSIFELQKEQMEFQDTWSQVINLAYKIELVINSCYVHFHPVWYNMASLFHIQDQIENVKQKLEKVKSCRIFSAEVIPHQPESSSTKPPETTWFSTTSEQEAVGLQKETRKIIDELIGGRNSLGIISIIGMGGLGKTTLAMEVYNSNIVRCHFHKFAFGCVSQVLNKANFFIEILCQIKSCTKEAFNHMTEDDLAHDLWRCLSGQPYLIIVDDIWEIKAWDAIKSSFPDDKNKSRVIFTSRELKVGLDAKGILHELQPLPDQESLKLLHIKVFGKEDCPPNFSEVGKIIVENCKGLPMSIVVVAGLLATNKTSLSWWEDIAEETCQLIGQECKEIIGLSYKHLPEHLKSCFLYMGMYGEDELIRTKRLVQLWIGEGFVKKSIGKSLRILAKEYLRDLAGRSLVTVVKTSGGGGIKRCHLHDLIRDFCRRQALEDKFVWLKEGRAASDSLNSNIHSHYRVSIKMDEEPFDDIEPTVVENVHSLLHWSKHKVPKPVWRKLKLVQVLHLQQINKVKTFLHLVHLRYIYIDQWYLSWEVPESICNLWNLETLIYLSKLSNKKLPKTIWKMKALRHLEFPRGCELVVDDDDHQGPDQLLENLEFLSDIWLSDDRTARVILQRLPNIQKLTCKLTGLKWKDEVLSIDFLNKLGSLCVHRNERVGAILFPSSLKRLNFTFSSHDEGIEDILSEIGRLPCLEVLNLHGDLEQWDIEDDQFQKLKYLKLELEDFEHWNVSFDSFSCLEKLKFYQCGDLEEIPACFADLSTLKFLHVKECNHKLESSAIQVQQEQKDNGNEVRLSIKSI